jgi:hypothetical protein
LWRSPFSAVFARSPPIAACHAGVVKGLTTLRGRAGGEGVDLVEDIGELQLPFLVGDVVRQAVGAGTRPSAGRPQMTDYEPAEVAVFGPECAEREFDG